MSDVEAQYKKCLSLIQSGAGGAEQSNEQKLQFYALFKQISQGPCRAKAPSRLKVVQYAKHQAYAKLGAMSKTDAMKAYVALYKRTVPSAKL